MLLCLINTIFTFFYLGRAASMKAAPVTQIDNVYTFKSGIKYTGVLDENFKR